MYLDASAMAQSPEMPMGTSTIGFIETVRTLGRVGSYPSAMQDLLGDFTEILVTDEIRDAAAGLPGGVRTLNAIHLASAQIIGDALAFLLSYDTHMLDVAHSIGIPVAAPGMPRQ